MPYHHTFLDEDNLPNLKGASPTENRQFFNVGKKWVDENYQTIEHIAPSNANVSYQSIYDEETSLAHWGILCFCLVG